MFSPPALLTKSQTPGEYFLIRGLWGCAAGWGRIFTTGLTIMGSHFQWRVNRVELLNWGRTFSDFWGKTLLQIDG